MFNLGFISGSPAKVVTPSIIPAFTPNNLIDAGYNWSPSQVSTPRLAEFVAMTKGAAYTWGLNNIVGTTGADNTQPKPAGNTLAIPGFNWRNIALQLQAAGAQYCILTVATAFGWSLFDCKTAWPLTPSIVTGTGTFATNWPSGLLIPYYNKYDVQQSYNPNTFQDFCYEMRNVGIEPIIYNPIHADIIRLGGLITDGQPTAIVNAFILFFCLWLQELIIRYGIRYFWLDGPSYGNVNGFMQKIYNAVKSVTGQNNENECLIIANALPGNEAADWPYDIRAFEYFIYGGNPAIFNRTLNINGTNYYVPVNMVECCAQNNYYYNIKPGLPGQGVLTNFSQSYLQAEKTLTETYNASFCLFLQPDYLGNMLPSQLTLLQGLT